MRIRRLPSLYTMALLLLTATVVGAQVPPADPWSTAPADSARQDFRRRLLQALDLTPAQEDTLRRLRARLQTDLDALRQEVEVGTLAADDARLRYGEALDAYRAQRDSVLTPEQVALLDRARSYQWDQALYGGAPPQVPKRLADALEMDDLQRRRWLSLLARQREEVRERRTQGSTITTDDYRRLREEYRIAFEAILTPAQRLELERIRVARTREQAELDAAQMDLIEGPSVEDGWKSLESDLGEDGAEP